MVERRFSNVQGKKQIHWAVCHLGNETSLRYAQISLIGHEFNAFIQQISDTLLTQYRKIIAPNNSEGHRDEEDVVLCCNSTWFSLFNGENVLLFSLNPCFSKQQI